LKSRKAKKTKNRNYILTGGAFSLLILVAIIAVVINKNEAAQTNISTNENSNLNSPSKSGVQEENNSSNEQNSGDSKSSETGESVSSENVNTNDEKSAHADYIENQPVPTEPTYINGILIVNKQYPIPSTYNKGEDAEATKALENMLSDGKDAGYDYVPFSGFRSYEYQTTLYNRYVNRDGKEAADRYSARPGHSEHQTGLAWDIGEKGQEDLWLTDEFGETKAGKWLMNNAHKYGFILRFPEGKEHITGFMYESWHYRYVGVKHAETIHEQNVTLEEYLKIVQ
jgi:zinc D-Ala-D-Ala carboxypeptidase